MNKSICRIPKVGSASQALVKLSPDPFWGRNAPGMVGGRISCSNGPSGEVS